MSCGKQLAPKQWWNFCGETDMGQTMPALCEECEPGGYILLPVRPSLNDPWIRDCPWFKRLANGTLSPLFDWFFRGRRARMNKRYEKAEAFREVKRRKRSGELLAQVLIDMRKQERETL